MMAAYEKDSYYKSVLILIILSLISAFFVYFPLTNTDIWWHLTAAREMLVRKSILYYDPFAYTLDNPKWIDIHWFFQIVSYAVYNFTGAGGLVLIRGLAVACICVILSLTVPNKRYMIITATVFTLLIYEVRYLVLIRPILVTTTCITIFIWAFERFIQTRKKRYLWLLLPVQIIWSNSQGLFPLGLTIAGCYLLGETMQRIIHFAELKSLARIKINKIVSMELAVIFVLIMSSCFINPYGWSGVLFPLKLFGRIDPSVKNVFAHNISENMPLLSFAGKDVHFVYAVALMTVVTLLTFWANKRAFRWAHLLLFGIFFSLAYMAKRNILLYFTVIPPIIGYNCLLWFEMKNRNGFHWLKLPRIQHTFNKALISIISIILVLFISLHANIVRKYPTKSNISPFRIPVGAVDYLKTHPVKGNMFNSVRYGGYLMWHFYPDKQVFIDGRLIIRSPNFYSEYLSILDDFELFSAIAFKFGITHVILPAAIVNRYMPLVKWLYKSPNWDLLFADGESVLFVNSEVNEYEKLNFEKSDDVESVKKRINIRWRNDRYIREEALGYFNSLIKYLNI